MSPKAAPWISDSAEGGARTISAAQRLIERSNKDAVFYMYSRLEGGPSTQ